MAAKHRTRTLPAYRSAPIEIVGDPSGGIIAMRRATRGYPLPRGRTLISPYCPVQVPRLNVEFLGGELEWLPCSRSIKFFVDVEGADEVALQQVAGLNQRIVFVLRYQYSGPSL